MAKKHGPTNVFNFAVPSGKRMPVSAPEFNSATALEDTRILSEDALRNKVVLLSTLLTLDTDAKAPDLNVMQISLSTDLREYFAIVLDHIGEQQAAQFMRADQFAQAMMIFSMTEMLQEFDQGRDQQRLPEKKTTKPGRFFQIKINLQNVYPPVWRIIVIPGFFTFEQLHKVIQGAMGWTDSHLHAFEWNGMRIGTADDAYNDEIDETSINLAEIGLRKKSKLLYTYDFGDDWVHELVVEDVGHDTSFNRAKCIDGAGACPPEDCGGAWRYSQLVAGAQQKLFVHPDEQEEIQWLQKAIAERTFDCSDANTLVQKIR